MKRFIAPILAATSIIALVAFVQFSSADQQILGVGSTANDHTGDPVRTFLGKANSNFTELYARSPSTNLDGPTVTNFVLSVGSNAVMLAASNAAVAISASSNTGPSYIGSTNIATNAAAAAVNAVLPLLGATNANMLQTATNYAGVRFNVFHDPYAAVPGPCTPL